MSEDGGGGSTDPLTKATRTAKRNLLIASLVTITFRAFDISAEKIPIAGVTITFQRGVFEFLLLVVLIYFLFTFVLYYYIDIRHFPPLEHQTDTEKWRASQLHGTAGRVYNTCAKTFNEWSTEDRRILLTRDFENHLERWIYGQPGFWALRQQMRLKPIDADKWLMLQRSKVTSKNLLYEKIADPNAEENALLERAHALLSQQTKSYLFSYTFARWRTLPRLWTVRAAYFTRNYVLDGLLPVFMAAVALAALYNLIDLHGLAKLAPSAPR